MTTLAKNPQETFNLLKEDPKNTFRGEWTITDEGYISIVNNTDTYGTMYSRCIFPVLLNDFSIEWTVKYIPGINPSTGEPKDTPVYCIDHYVSEDPNFWLLDESNSTSYDDYILYCLLNNYGDAAGSITSLKYNVYSFVNIPLSREEDNSFKFVRENGKYTLYKDGEQVSQVNDPRPNKGVYISWTLGGMNNPSLIIKDYKLISLDGIEDPPESKRYLDKIGLSYFWNKIKSLFKTHTDNSNIHITSDERDKWNAFDNSAITYMNKQNLMRFGCGIQMAFESVTVSGSDVAVIWNKPFYDTSYKIVCSSDSGQSIKYTDVSKTGITIKSDGLSNNTKINIIAIGTWN